MKTKRILNPVGVIFVTCLFILLSSQMASAANQYILDGATGTYATTNCDSWAANRACNDLPLSLVRGDTYFIADGSYARHIFNDAESGSTYITIKKATTSDHGTDVGWNSAYGDGQASFAVVAASGYETGLKFRTGYYVFDGVTGSGNDPSSYGFKIAGVGATNKQYLIGLPMLGDSSYQLDHITVSHTALVTSGQGTGTYTQVGIYSLPRDASYASSDITISNNYLSNASSNILMRQARNWTIRDNYFDGNWSAPANHGQQISPATSSSVFLYNNIFKNSATFIIGAHNEGGGNSNWQVFNNIAVGGALSAGFAMAESGEVDGLINSNFNNNTFVGVDFGGRGAVFVGTLSDVATQKSYAYNNLFYNCINPRMDNVDKTAGAIVHDNNAYIAGTGIFSNADESASKVGIDDPFVDAANGKYQLKVGSLPINAGKTLIAAYSTARDGVARPQGGAWDIGSYEYLPAQSTLFVTSVNGTVTSNPSGINCGSTCYANFDAEASVTLNALPKSGYTFAGWSGGGCSGTGICAVNMASAQVVTANYTVTPVTPPTATYYLAVSKAIVGAGTIISSDNTINCGSTCKANYNAGKTVNLTVLVNNGYKFSRWTGACKGQGATCTVNMTASQNTKAYFAESK
ncbi:MAG: InlB B-repeat-containing protein [Smithellaceae bacterium]